MANKYCPSRIKINELTREREMLLASDRYIRAYKCITLGAGTRFRNVGLFIGACEREREKESCAKLPSRANLAIFLASRSALVTSKRDHPSSAEGLRSLSAAINKFSSLCVHPLPSRQSSLPSSRGLMCRGDLWARCRVQLGHNSAH